MRAEISEVQRSSRTSRRHRNKTIQEPHAVFTEQGSSASQMTAAQEMDVIARQPKGDGQAADAVTAKWRMLPRFQSQNVQIFGYVY